MKYNTEISVNDVPEKEGKRLFIIPLVVCLILSFGIWLYVVNISTDNYERTFTLKDITVNGADLLAEKSNMSVIEEPNGTVTITVSGLRSEIINLSEDDFAASVDVGYLTEAGEHSLDVSVKLPSGVSLITMEPSAMNVSIDEIKTIEVPVEVAILSYTMDATYHFGNIEQDVKVIDVKGPATVLEKIKCARATLELGNVTTSVEQKAELRLINAITDNPLESRYTNFITVGADGVTVKVSVYTESEVSLVTAYESGFDSSIIRSVTVNPAKITVKGDPKAVNAVSQLTVLGISEATPEHTDISVSEFALPSGIEIVSELDTVSVDILFEPSVDTEADIDVENNSDNQE